MTQGAKPKLDMTDHKFKPVEEQLAYIKKGAAEIIPENELVAKLENSRKTGKPLRVYLGVDPTAPDLHLGHTVVLRKLKHFQDLGHIAVFLIGDFSAMIGDPTGVSETRPPLTREQVDANAETYLAQVFKILDREKTEVRRNSDWLGKMNAEDVVRLCSHYRLARMLEREDFRSRLDKGQPISVHELLYPLLTARDAVELKSDVELGATEQKFNLLVHREIQREYGLSGQAILTMPILVGLDGHRKMSKSLGNYVGITEPPNEMFGKIMSISDDLMWSYYELLTDLDSQTIADMKDRAASGASNPKNFKILLAQTIIRNFQGDEAQRQATENFQRFSVGLPPKDVREVVVTRESGSFFWYEKAAPLTQRVLSNIPPSGAEKWIRILVVFDLVSSAAEGERLLKQGGFEINGQVFRDPSGKIELNLPASYVLRVGKKKFLWITVE